MTENIRLNALTGVTARRAALAAESGRRRLVIDPMNTGANSIEAEGGEVAETCECLSLEAAMDLCGISELDVLKLDCEGAEFGILMQAPRALLSRIRLVSMEVHPDYGDVTKLVTYLQESGFRVRGQAHGREGALLFRAERRND